MNELQKAILQTLAYADVFDYPLILPELHQFLIKEKASIKDLEKATIEFKEIARDGQFFFLKNRQKIVRIRQKRFYLSQSKLKIARKVAKYLKVIPYIKMVAITGNLAMNNTEKKDDIDLLIIASKNHLWLTRLFTVLLVELVANRRRPRETNVEDKICLNMFLDEDHLEIPEKEQDLFSAHEVCQLKPTWSKDNVYQEFITQNQWYQKFLPNWKP